MIEAISNLDLNAVERALSDAERDHRGTCSVDRRHLRLIVDELLEIRRRLDEYDSELGWSDVVN